MEPLLAWNSLCGLGCPHAHSTPLPQPPGTRITVANNHTRWQTQLKSLFNRYHTGSNHHHNGLLESRAFQGEGKLKNKIPKGKRL